VRTQGSAVCEQFVSVSRLTNGFRTHRLRARHACEKDLMHSMMVLMLHYLILVRFLGRQTGGEDLNLRWVFSVGGVRPLTPGTSSSCFRG